MQIRQATFYENAAETSEDRVKRGGPSRRVAESNETSKLTPYTYPHQRKNINKANPRLETESGKRLTARGNQFHGLEEREDAK